MSQNNTLVEFSPLSMSPPVSGYARFGVRNDHPVLYFTSTGIPESGFFSAVMPNYYSNRGINLNIAWSTLTGTAGYCKWNAAIERLSGNADMKISNFGAIQTNSGQAPSSSGLIQYLTLPMTGIYSTGIQPGEMFRLMFQRDNIQNSLSGDVELYFLELREA